MNIPDNAPQMDFTVLTGDINWKEYGGKWISTKLNNGEFDYWLVIEFINWLDATGDLFDDNEFLVSITSVSPDSVPQKELDNAFDCCGYTDENFTDVSDKDLDKIKVEALSTYGISAHLWQESGNNADLLLKRAKQSAFLVSGLFGFFMDSPQNRIGSTGWDCIKGNILAGLDRLTSDHENNTKEKVT